MKILNFPDDITIFLLRYITCHTIIQSILKSHQKASSSKTKIQASWAGACKNRIDKEGQIVKSQL